MNKQEIQKQIDDLKYKINELEKQMKDDIVSFTEYYNEFIKFNNLYSNIFSNSINHPAFYQNDYNIYINKEEQIIILRTFCERVIKYYIAEYQKKYNPDWVCDWENYNNYKYYLYYYTNENNIDYAISNNVKTQQTGFYFSKKVADIILSFDSLQQRLIDEFEFDILMYYYTEDEKYLYTDTNILSIIKDKKIGVLK